MVGKAELLAWVNTLDNSHDVGIDEGGLMLVELLADGTMGPAFLEVGGIPEEVEHAD